MPDKTSTPAKNSKMRQEILEIPEAVSRLLVQGAPEIRATAARLRDHDPAFAISIARGSSDHACSYFKYASEILAGIPVCSVGPSVASIYKAPLKLKNSFSLAVSQSGKSPDIVEMARAARRDGAFSIALTNNPQSDLARVSAETIDIHAGPELSVAATKTFVNSVVASLILLAEWRQDDALKAALSDLPGARVARGYRFSPLALYPRARAGLGHFKRGCPQVQGNLPDPRRKLFHGRSVARPGLDRRRRLSGAVFCVGRCRRGCGCQHRG